MYRHVGRNCRILEIDTRKHRIYDSLYKSCHRLNSINRRMGQRHWSSAPLALPRPGVVYIPRCSTNPTPTAMMMARESVASSMFSTRLLRRGFHLKEKRRTKSGIRRRPGEYPFLASHIQQPALFYGEILLMKASAWPWHQIMK